MTGSVRKPGRASVRRSPVWVPAAVLISVCLGLAFICGCLRSPDEDILPPSPVSSAPSEVTERARETTQGVVARPDPGGNVWASAGTRQDVRVVISPRVPRVGDTLTARVEPYDPGRAAFHTYRWFINGEVPPGGQRDTFEGAFKRGDAITVVVVLADGLGTDTPLTDLVLVGNSPPQVEELQSPRFEDGTYRTRIVASDPDGDPLAFSVVKAPAGLVVDERGKISWVPGEDDFGRHEVAISIRDDAGGEVLYTYGFSIQHQQH